ncbi:hypothetical protein BH20ACT2_BH20ACT2_03480 [soil metagenome]
MPSQPSLRRRRAIIVLVGLVGSLLVPSVAGTAEVPAPVCGPLDHPETGIQGDVPLVDQLTGRAYEGYNCGLALVGYQPLSGRGGNANMAWAGDCAYVSGDGIAVIDVSDPALPRHVTTLRGAGSDATVETLHAVVADDRAILVAGRYGLFGFSGFGPPAPVDVYDVGDCTDPTLLSSFEVPNNVHNLTLSDDATRMYSTLPLQVADLTDPRNPRVLGNLEDDLRAAGVSHLEYAHEALPSPDGTRLYIGGQIAGEEELLTVDIEGWPARPATVLGRVARPGHSIRRATIDGRPHLLHSDESVINPTAKGCLPEELTPVGGASQPYLTDISDERAPATTSQVRLAINEPANCLAQIASGVNASVHYHDVDDPDDTTFAMLSMWHAGLRIVDVRDPANPREVAYFNPGRFRGVDLLGGAAVDPFLSLQTPNGLDQAWAHVRYVAETGHVWLATRSGGFWVLELEPQVRRALDLPERPVRFPDGATPRPPATDIGVGLSGPPGLFCTLGATSAALTGLVS